VYQPLIDVQSVAMMRRAAVAGIGSRSARPAAPRPRSLAPPSPPRRRTEPSEQIPVELSKPDGPGPFPALVIMHDCSGLGPRSSGAPGRWAQELVARGYVVIMPDSFTTRGFPDGVCTDGSRGRDDVSPARRVRDAYSALAHLCALPYVDGAHVGLMGGSHGGSTTLTSMIAPDTDADLLARERRAGFAAAVALYPGCRGIATDLEQPGCLPARCATADPDRRQGRLDARGAVPAADRGGATGGYPVTIKVYPGAYDSFDSSHPVRYVATRINANAPGGRGATTGGDPAAWADSIREVVAFFGRHLR
jgi:dienelactone hydrolase